LNIDRIQAGPDKEKEEAYMEQEYSETVDPDAVTIGILPGDAGDDGPRRGDQRRAGRGLPGGHAPGEEGHEEVPGLCAHHKAREGQDPVEHAQEGVPAQEKEGRE